MGMDWHSSGITTSVIGALKRGLTPLERELGIHVCGGRGNYRQAREPAEPPPAAQPMPVLVDELERLVRTLQDDAARTKLVEQLRALIAVQRGAETEKPAATALFGQLSQQIDAFSGEVLAGVAMVVDAPRLFGWARPSHELRIADGEHAVLPLPLSGDKLVAGFPFGAKDVERVVKLRTIEFRFAADSPLEEAGFEPSVPRLG